MTVFEAAGNLSPIPGGIPLGPDRWIWATPHGLHRLVTTTGTTTTRGEFQALKAIALHLANDLAA